MRSYNLFPRQLEVEPKLRGGSFTLNWDMRLGKTRACLHAFDKLWQAGGPRIAIIVCPSIAKGVWLEENAEMGLQLPTVKLDGISRRRATGERIAGLPLLIIVNWEIVNAHLTELMELAPGAVLILDESHDHCCNPRNDRYRAVRDLSLVCDRTWILTGTLYRTTAMDFHWQLRLMGPRAYPFYFTKGDDFGERFCHRRVTSFKIASGPRKGEVRTEVHWKGILDGREAELVNMPSIDRRLEELEETPDELTWWLDENDEFEYTGGNEEGAMSRARSELSDLKAKRTVEFVRRNHLTDEPLVIFGWHKRFIRHVAAELGAGVIDGDTSSDHKTELVKWFRSTKQGVLVANIRSAGVAVDFANARNAVFGEIDWVKATMAQAEARIRGPKQTRKVSYFYVLCRNSVDDYVWRTCLGRGRDMKRIDAALAAS